MKKLISVMIVVIIALALQAHIEHTTRQELQLELSYCLIDKTLLEARMETTEPIKVVSSTKIIKPCTDSTFKSYMDYRMITNTSSEQYRLQQSAYTESKYGLRMIDSYFLIAVTSQFGSVGDLVEVHTSDMSFYAIIGDIKDAGHDDCQSLRDTSVIEFIVDNDTLHNSIRVSGNLNHIFSGEVEMINNLGGYK